MNAFHHFSLFSSVSQSPSLTVDETLDDSEYEENEDDDEINLFDNSVDNPDVFEFRLMDIFTICLSASHMIKNLKHLYSLRSASNVEQYILPIQIVTKYICCTNKHFVRLMHHPYFRWLISIQPQYQPEFNEKCWCVVNMCRLYDIQAEYFKIQLRTVMSCEDVILSIIAFL